MKMEELKKKTTSELNDLLLQSKREKLNLRFQKVSGNLASSAEIRKARKRIARIKTLFNAEAKKA